jgi:CRP/FNR family transcriptional regulator, dissimilatory nitrate respiration regulator
MNDAQRTAIIGSLRACRLFAGMSPADLASIAEITVVKRVNKNDVLFHQGQHSEGFFIVQSGAINVHRVSPSGKEQVIRIFRAPESFAEASLGSGEVYPVTARAVQPSQVLLVHRSGFVDLLRHHPELGLRLMASMSSHLHDLVGQVEDLALKNVESRLAGWLLKRCPDPRSPQPHELELSVTKTVLAAELGTSSETLSRTLAQLRHHKLIDVRGRSITITAPARLSVFFEGSTSR